MSTETALSHWELCVTDASACADPSELHAVDWIAAFAPGTAAEALKRAGRWDGRAPLRLHDQDVWYRCEIDAQAGDELCFAGLATIADIFLDGVLAASSASMFAPLRIVAPKSGQLQVAIAFRSLNTHLAGLKGKRARWRTALVANQNLRLVRTTLLGHMSGWQPPIDIVGPYRQITLTPRGALWASDFRIETSWENDVGQLTVSARDLPADARLHCAGEAAPFVRDGEVWRASLQLNDIEPWAPHTHGRAALYDAHIRIGDQALELGAVGFRSIAIDRGADGSRFGFVINGKKIFARGVCWTTSDFVALPCDKDTYLRELGRMREAGFNMVRVPGITLYEAPAFYDAACELGLMVWLELQFANFDYPFGDEKFLAQVTAEVKHAVGAARGLPALVAVCGGSEVMQQAAMMGLPESVWQSAANDATLKPMVAAERADVAFIANSPCDGALPFHVNHGVGHYYGVGAYMRPLEDARRADVAFAAECLAFSNVPDDTSLRGALTAPAVHHPDWKAAVPRDRGASWDFEDVREHYMNLLYGVDCGRVRREDPSRYLAIARAAPAEVMEATYAEWRRPGSRTDGALAFLWKDAMPGAGWGVVDSSGRPKSVWYALKRCLQPVQALLTDEGVNGLHVHVLNETPAPRRLTVRLACVARSGHEVAQGEREIELGAGGAATLNATDFLGAFFDVNYAYRFGPAAHCAVAVHLLDESGATVSRAFHFPLGRASLVDDPGLEAELCANGDGYALALECRRVAQSVAIDIDGFVPEDNYFHLAPGERRMIALRATGEAPGKPSGAVAALNSAAAVSF